MLSTSIEFQKMADEDARWLAKAQLVFADGTRLDLAGESFAAHSFAFDQSTSAQGSFDIGAAIIGSFRCTLDNGDRSFDECDFTGSRILPMVGMGLESGDEEWLRKGTYWVEQPSSYGETIGLTCLDSMSKLDVPYDDVPTVYPATARAAVQDIAAHCGVTQANPYFVNSDAVLASRPENCTCRQVLSWICQISCNFARMTNDDRLLIDWYDPTVFKQEDWLDGQEFDDGDPYQSGSDADGGSFEAYGSGYAADGGSFDSLGTVNIYAYSSATIATDDVVVTGIRVYAQDEVLPDGTRGEKGEAFLVGEEGYVIEVTDNPFVPYGGAKAAAERIAVRVVGLLFRPFDVSCLGNPSVEAGDAAILTDRYQNVYRAYLTRVAYKVGSFAALSCSAEPPMRLAASSAGAANRVARAMADGLRAEHTAREAMEQRFNDELANAPGMHFTEKREGGATTWYMHDRKELADSEFVWKVNSAGFGMSTDGGKTYPHGLDKWGNAILDTIYAIGIDASYINTGSLTVKNGNKVIFCADVTSGQFWWNATYSQLTNQGFLTVTSGKIGGFTISSTAIQNGAMILDQSGLKLGTLMTLNSTGVHLASDKGGIGHIETNGLKGYPNWKGILFNLDYDDGWYIAWAVQKSRGADPECVLMYSNTSDSRFTRGQLHLGCVLNCQQFAIRDTTIENSWIETNTWFKGGIDGSTYFYAASGYKAGTNTLQLYRISFRFSHGFVTGMDIQPFN